MNPAYILMGLQTAQKILALVEEYQGGGLADTNFEARWRVVLSEIEQANQNWERAGE